MVFLIEPIHDSVPERRPIIRDDLLWDTEAMSPDKIRYC